MPALPPFILRLYQPADFSAVLAVIQAAEEADDLPPIYSDESKLSQILRNFISNALKYTDRGEVRVAARFAPKRDAIEFSVADN